jgi:hypothetical protein
MYESTGLCFALSVSRIGGKPISSFGLEVPEPPHRNLSEQLRCDSSRRGGNGLPKQPKDPLNPPSRPAVDSLTALDSVGARFELDFKSIIFGFRHHSAGSRIQALVAASTECSSARNQQKGM